MISEITLSAAVLTDAGNGYDGLYTIFSPPLPRVIVYVVPPSTPPRIDVMICFSTPVQS